MGKISISNLKIEKSTRKKRHSVPDLSSLSIEYSNQNNEPRPSKETYNKPTTKKAIIRQQLDSNKTADKTARGSNSSSDLYKTTTTIEDKENRLIDKIVAPEKIKRIGFGKTQINQLEGVAHLSVEQLQTSLEHFAFDLDSGNINIKTSPLNLFMGSLRNGGGYTSSKYVVEEEAALDRQLRIHRERKERAEKKREELEELLFGAWLETKTKEELVGIEEPGLDGYMGIFHKPKIKDYFIGHEMETFRKETEGSLSGAPREEIQ